MFIKLSNKAYDVGKYIAAIALPAVASLYAGLGALWGFPNTTQVVGTITLVDTALGSLLVLSTAAYKKEIQDNPGLDSEDYSRENTP